jgi:hypothetical protein
MRWRRIALAHVLSPKLSRAALMYSLQVLNMTCLQNAALSRTGRAATVTKPDSEVRTNRRPHPRIAHSQRIPRTEGGFVSGNIKTPSMNNQLDSMTAGGSAKRETRHLEQSKFKSSMFIRVRTASGLIIRLEGYM